MAKVLVSDPLAPPGLPLFERAKGSEVANEPGSSPGGLDWVLAGADARAVRRGGELAANRIAAGDGLRGVSR